MLDSRRIDQNRAESSFSAADHETWRMLFSRLNAGRARMAHSRFLRGLQTLGMTEERIPALEDVNARLKMISDFKAVFVRGLEPGAPFYSELARREFPVGHFIRDRGDLGYTPEPDVFHDFYGHVPFFADRDYADFCAEYGAMVMANIDDAEKLRRFERFFWFTIEFALIESKFGRQIFGAGLLSSFEESHYSLSPKPEVLPFDVGRILDQEFRIDIIQPRLFVLKNESQLFSSLALVASQV